MIFVLGQAHFLAEKELQEILRRFPGAKLVKKLSAQLIEVSISEEDAAAILKLSGGVVKVVVPLVTVKLEEVAGAIALDLEASANKAFIISNFGNKPNVDSLAQVVKNLLTEKGVKSRFRITKSPLVSAGVVKDYQEYILHLDGETVLVTKTVLVQDINHWNEKDYSRPVADPHSGMLPPKVARMMVNLAVDNDTKTVYDPFCGSGTILQEALDLGFNAIGSDLDQKAVGQAQMNAAWFMMQFKPQYAVRVFQKDAAHVTPEDVQDHPDAIVFEGYLGPPNPQPEKIKDLAKGLGKLYLGVLKNLAKLQSPGNRIVCALPQFATKSGVKKVLNLIDTCEKLGYTVVETDIVYARPQAVVQRNISVLQKL